MGDCTYYIISVPVSAIKCVCVCGGDHSCKTGLLPVRVVVAGDCTLSVPAISVSAIKCVCVGGRAPLLRDKSSPHEGVRVVVAGGCILSVPAISVSAIKCVCVCGGGGG